MRSRGVLYALAAVALLAGGYVWIFRSAPPPPAGPLESVVIANVRYPGTCPVAVAQANGYFQNEGIAATVQHYTAGKLTLDAVFQGRADFATTGDLPVMFAVMSGEPASIVATIATAENDLGIVGRKDKGVLAAADLKGKQIGVTLKSGGQFVLDVVLTRQKLTVSDVQIRDLKPEELSAALANGDIDAASTWQPYLGTLQRQLSSNGTVFLSGGVYDVALNLVATKSFVADRPETSRKVLRALVRAARFCEDNPAAAQSIVAEAMKPDVVDLQALWPAYRFGVVLDQSLILALEDETRWAIRNNLVGNPGSVNYLDHIHLDALRSVAPSAISIIQ